MGKVNGHVDKDKGTVSLEFADVDANELDGIIEWLNKARAWGRRKKEAEGGGRRWEFARPGPARAPVARRMFGADQRGPDIPLVSIYPRKETTCASCKREVSGEAMWRQAPGCFAGYSRFRFCERCVEAGGPPKPPKLRVIQGGS